MPEIILQHVTKRFDKFVAVQDLDLQIQDRGFITLLGPSGCGKTTTGRTILRLYDSKSGGQVLFNGQEVYDLSHKELRALRTKMQIIFQDPFSSLSPRMPVGEIIGEAVREHNLVPKNEFNDYIDQVMDDCGLQPYHKTRYPHEFSGGQRQRITIARALLQDRPILVLDEATALADPENEAVIQEAISRLTKGKTLIVIAHRLSTITDSDQIVVVKDGTIQAKGTHEELLKECSLYHTMWTAHMDAKEVKTA